ncbi:hypothetical protein [Pseudophaeobacter sp.]|uniref:hypothetical protein n=1 Tax=Pseudophaeobacter sp. TaxID=1971739 RepID=UPI00329A1A68
MPVLRFLFWILVGWQGALLIWLVKLLPWWVFFGLAYFSFSQAGPEYNKYQAAMGEVVADTEPPRAPLALIENFDPTRDLGPADELLVLAKWSKDLPIIEFDGASILDFTVVPLLSTTEDWVVGLAFASKADREQLVQHMRANLQAGGGVRLHGRYKNVPFTTQRIQTEMQVWRARFNRLGYQVAQDLVIVRPYLEGRHSELARSAEAFRFWTFVLLASAGLWLVLGTFKLIGFLHSSNTKRRSRVL